MFKVKGLIVELDELKIVRCKCGPVVFPFLIPLDKIVGPTVPINWWELTLSPSEIKKVSPRWPYNDFIPFEWEIMIVLPYPL